MQFNELKAHVGALTPLDGSKTKSSVASVGLLVNSTISPDEYQRWTTIPVCALFASGAVRAAAQATPLPGFSGRPTDVFVTTKTSPVPGLTGGTRQFVDDLTPATVVHEALHQVTSKDDYDLAVEFSQHDSTITNIPAFVTRASRNTALLSDKLEQHSCAPK
jgi:hypothetical protein